MINRYTSRSQNRYCSKGSNNAAWKKLQKVEDLEEQYGESIFDLVKPPLIAHEHLHAHKGDREFIVSCECVFGTVVWNDNYRDNYCSKCGRKVIWDYEKLKEAAKNQDEFRKEIVRLHNEQLRKEKNEK